jgi:hypothetical protein
VAPLSEGLWPKFWRAIERLDLVEDPPFDTNAKRSENEDAGAVVAMGPHEIGGTIGHSSGRSVVVPSYARCKPSGQRRMVPVRSLAAGRWPPVLSQRWFSAGGRCRYRDGGASSAARDSKWTTSRPWINHSPAADRDRILTATVLPSEMNRDGGVELQHNRRYENPRPDRRPALDRRTP